ncbi:hypothetical protein [Ancylobacter pratisalsi]|uniref:Fibronectin type-III domain-containing protein n=1 Tax=Ancylobacter pratisalsi TaxID=1745854 RepID=A0A6P1YIY9_9HYPH|nr:hypothetical protein [Ancylobacter pratisalsi]QIB32631.1 hypothetical protein G3A50_02115 [Ancylobacter pratisalsi]
MYAALTVMVLLALTVPASADAGLGALIAFAFLPASTSASVIAAASSLITLGISVGVSYLAAALLAPSTRAPTPQEVKTTLRNSVGSRWRHYGHVLVGGSMAMTEAKDGDLHRVIAFASHKMHAQLGWVIDGRGVAVDGAGWVTSAPYPANTVRIEYRPGDASQTAYSSLVSALGSPYWTTDHRGDGVAHAYLRARNTEPEQLSATYPNRFPELQGIFEGAEVYDPRTASVGYTANLALGLRDYLTHVDGLQIDPAYIDDADFIAAADASDVPVPIKVGGTIPRYYGALSYKYDAEPQSVLSRFITMCDGDIRLKPNGKIGFSVGVWVEPTVTITDEQIIDIDLSDGGGPLREANEYRLKYTDTSQYWAEVEAEPWRIEDEISDYGEVRSVPIEAYEVQHHNLARRLMKIAAFRGSPRWQGKIKTTLAGLRAWDQRWIRVQIADMEIDETFEVSGVEFDMASMTVVLGIASFSAAAYTFDPATEEGTAPTAAEAVPESTLPVPADFAATGSSIAVSDGVSTPAIIATWTEASRPGIRVEVQYANQSDGIWQPGGSADDGEQRLLVLGLANGATYDVRGRNVGVGSASGWVTISGVTATADSAAPAAPVITSLSGTTSASITWKMPNSPNVVAARVYRGPTGAFPGPGGDISGPIYGAPNALGSYDDSPGAGPWYYWVKAENGSGVQSAADGPETITLS